MCCFPAPSAASHPRSHTLLQPRTRPPTKPHPRPSKYFEREGGRQSGTDHPHPPPPSPSTVLRFTVPASPPPPHRIPQQLPSKPTNPPALAPAPSASFPSSRVLVMAQLRLCPAVPPPPTSACSSVSGIFLRVLSGMVVVVVILQLCAMLVLGVSG